MEKKKKTDRKHGNGLLGRIFKFLLGHHSDHPVQGPDLVAIKFLDHPEEIPNLKADVEVARIISKLMSLDGLDHLQDRAL